MINHVDWLDISPDKIVERAKQDWIELADGHHYYNVHALAVKFRVPAYYFTRLVTRGIMHGRRIGKGLFISAEEFHEFIMSGHFQEYRPRGSRKRPIEEDIKLSQSVLDQSEKTMRGT